MKTIFFKYLLLASLLLPAAFGFSQRRILVNGNKHNVSTISGLVNLTEAGDPSNGEAHITDLLLSTAATPVSIVGTPWSVSLTTASAFLNYDINGSATWGDAIFSDLILNKNWAYGGTLYPTDASVLTITGLTVSKTYTVILAIADNEGPGDGLCTFQVGSASPQTIATEPNGPPVQKLTFTAVSPDGSGHLAITFQAADGSSYLIFNAFFIQQLP